MTALEAFIAAEVNRPVPEPVAAFAAEIAARGGVCAVLFYGSALRTGELDGVLDFYVIVETLRGWRRGDVATAANAVLPPNIEYWEHEAEGLQLRAKIAVLRSDQFEALTRRRSLDTTVWARFTQPVALVWSRDEAARRDLVRSLAQAAATAARWAAHLGPERGRAGDYWRELFDRTYGAELRVEAASRAGDIVASGGDRYTAVLPLAWEAGGIAFERDDESLVPRIDLAGRRRAARAWRRRRVLGKPLNMIRLAKASFTFAGGPDYIAWKIERHSAVKIELSGWRRRHPLLASGGVLWRLWRAGALR